jgi:hypothetical protein
MIEESVRDVGAAIGLGLAVGAGAFMMDHRYGAVLGVGGLVLLGVAIVARELEEREVPS